MSLFDSIAGAVSGAASKVASSAVAKLTGSPFGSMVSSFMGAAGLMGGSKVLTSQWTGLNPALIARFYPVRRTASGGWERSTGMRQVSAADTFSVDDDYEVWSPITDGTKELSLNWQSPFEHTGTDQKAPALSAMLQSGSLNSILQAMGERLGAQGAAAGAQEAMASAQGRAGITKLNSTQVFAGMPPIKLNLTLHFRALIDPVAEVQAPVAQLQEWAVPQYLANDGVLANAVKNGDKEGLVETIFPSVVPQIIGMTYGDMALMPLVIESISEPFTAPRSSDGVIIAQSLQVSLATLAALDRRDIQRIYSR